MKDNLPILEVKALGGFSMRYGEKTISIGSGKSTKAVKLFADSGMQRGTYCFQRTIVGYVVWE